MTDPTIDVGLRLGPETDPVLDTPIVGPRPVVDIVADVLLATLFNAEVDSDAGKDDNVEIGGLLLVVLLLPELVDLDKLEVFFEEWHLEVVDFLVAGDDACFVEDVKSFL